MYSVETEKETRVLFSAFPVAVNSTAQTRASPIPDHSAACALSTTFALITEGKINLNIFFKSFAIYTKHVLRGGGEGEKERKKNPQLLISLTAIKVLHLSKEIVLKKITKKFKMLLNLSLPHDKLFLMTSCTSFKHLLAAARSDLLDEQFQNMWLHFIKLKNIQKSSSHLHQT